ncbi:MAG: hypothetical protein HGN29_05475 [Asgard group archaeon]|nr:hypothetical protein [Asgard group archaeon]
MRKNKIKFKGRMIVFILLFSLFVFLSPLQNDTTVIQAASSTFNEDFTSTTYMDVSNTNVSGWGTGNIENSKKKPTLVGSISSFLIGNTLDVFVDGNYAYVTNQGEGLKIVNITDPTNPAIIGSYDTPNIAQSVYVAGDCAFIADYQGEFPDYENFLLVNVTDPTNPTDLGNCSTILALGDAARDVIVAGNIAFIANDQGGLSVVNVTDTSNPIRIGVRDTPGTSSNLVVAGDYVYLADGENGLVVINIANPLNPTIVATYNADISFVVNVAVEGNYAYAIDLNNGVIVLDITDITTPTFVGLWSKSGVSAASVCGDYLYVTDINDGLSVVNIADPTTPVFINTLSLPGNPSAIGIEGDYAYFTCQSGGFQITQIKDFGISLAGSYYHPAGCFDVSVSGDYAYVADSGSLKIIDISAPSAPTLVGSYSTFPFFAWAVFVSGAYAYVGDGSGGIGLIIIDISTPSAPTLVGSYDTPGLVYGIFVSGDYAYVADGSSGLLVLDISAPSAPTPVGSYDTPGFAWDVFVSGAYAYVGDESDLIIIDISAPSTPTLAGSYDTPGRADGVFVSEDYAYVADVSSGLLVLDISAPSAPTLVGSYDTPGSARSVFVSGDYACVADGGSGLIIIDISAPSTPTLAGSYDTPELARNVFVSGDYSYVADTYTLQIIELKKHRASQFVSPCVAQSTIVFTANSATIVSATLVENSNTPAPTSISYSLSADNGINWELVTPGTKNDFVNTGNQLKWKAILTTSDVLVTPMLYSLSITYNTILIVPALNTPTEGYLSVDYTPTFTWSGINGETDYLFQLATSTSFTSPLYNTTLPSSSSSYTISSPLAIDTYYWRVAGIDTEGDLGKFSDYRTLYIIQDTNSPIIDHPSDIFYEFGSTGNTITWSPTDSNPYWYNITLNGILTSHDDPWVGGNIVMDIDGLSLGIHTAICYVYDLEGFMISDTVEIEVTSTAPPTIDDVANFEYEEGDTGNSITWHPSDTNPDYYSITRDGVVIDDYPWLGGDINIDIDGLAYGAYTFVCTVNDTEGQEASDTVIVTVTDSVDPVLNSPADIIYSEGDTGNNIIWIATDTNPATYIVYKDGTLYEPDTWTSSSSIIISVDGLASDQYNFTIVVFDQAGNSVKDTVIVGVTVAVPEFNQSILFVISSFAMIYTVFCVQQRNKKRR